MSGDRPGPAPRSVELALVLLAGVLTVAGLVLVELGALGRVTVDPALLGGGVLGLFLLAHLAVRRTAPAADPLLLPIAMALNGLGIVVIHRLDLAAAASAALAGQPTPTADAPRQLIWTAIGIVAFGVLCHVVRDHRRLARYAYTLGLGGLVLLVLPGLLPASISEVNGAKLWIRIGPLSLQPGEFAKIMIIVFAAAFLASTGTLFTTAGRRLGRFTLPRLRDVAPLLIAWGLAVLVLTVERELGASLLVFTVVLLMVYVATGRVGWLLWGAVFFAVAGVVAYFLFAHVRTRFQVWLGPTADYLGAGYQVSQSLFGLGTGGIFGTGLGLGRPDLVPLANADFVASAVGEELGLIGLSAVLVLYLLLACRGLVTALRLPDRFGSLLATGLGATIAVQVFIVVGGATNLIPETGLTTPFLSYGGSSLLANHALLALLVVLSHRARAGEPARTRPVGTIASDSTAVVAVDGRAGQGRA